ncbi:MAG: hypothetical protein CMB64_04965 [Euryarchaeota archaeon]|nr:hypothetical protein [Euryarchaeota archaeon]|tara:strand:- start:2099 stop:2608 length:510 start_codon:yes stop_codon:yes gene_type:complete
MPLANHGILVESIKSFFENTNNYEKLTKLLKCRRLQPRLIDYFVTQMAKNEPQFFMLSVNGETWGICDVYTSYKNQLKAYHKKNFSLFDKRMTIKIDNISQPLSKLNVYKWLIQNDIYEIIYTNIQIIQKKYYEYRKKCCVKKQIKKRGRMKSFINNPVFVKIGKVNVK